MLRTTLKLTQCGILKRAMIMNVPYKNWDCKRMVLDELKSPIHISIPFGSSPFSLPLARFYAVKSSNDGNDRKSSSGPSGFTTPNILEPNLTGGIIGGDGPSLANPTASANVNLSSNDESKNSSSSYGHSDEVFKKGSAGEETKELLKKGITTSEMAAGQTMPSSGKLGTAQPIECINATQAKAASVPSSESTSGDEKKAKAKSENATPSALNDAVNMANKQIQEIIANSPDKQQVEKFFFRVVAFIYDLTYLLGTSAVRFIEKNIIQNKTVQQYWKRLHEKMEEAKKD